MWLVTFPLLLTIHLHISHKPRQGSQFETTCILASFSGTAQFFHCFSVLQVTENWICRWIFRKLSGGAQFSVACNTKKKQWMMTIWGGPGYLAHTTMIIPKRHTHKHCLFLSRSHSDIVCKEHTQPHTNAPPTDDCKLFPIIHRPHLDEEQ